MGSQRGNQGISKRAIRAELDKVLQSNAFPAFSQSRKLLEYLVHKTLMEGSEEEFTPHNIGLKFEWFNLKESDWIKPDGFPEVRSAASRLRDKLRKYYEGEGRCDSVRIAIKKGRHYLPSFDYSPASLPSAESTGVTPRAAPVEDGVASEPLVCFQLLDSRLEDLFCQLTIFPNSFDAAGAAAVWEMKPEEAAREALDQLKEFHLVECNSATQCYRVPDPSVRKFAFGRLTKAQRELAQLRHANHYKGIAAASQRLYLAGWDNVKRGLDLFRLEWKNIELGQQWAASRIKIDDDAARLCSDYLLAAEYCLEVRQRPSVRIWWGEAALAAAQKLKDRVAECSHHETLGLAYSELGDPRTAREHHVKEQALAKKIGDRRMEGYALNGRGFDSADEGKTKEAIRFYEKALAIFNEVGHPLGKAYALGNLATEYIKLKRPDLALEKQNESYAISLANGYRRHEAYDLDGFGEACAAMGKPREAIKWHKKALAIADHELEDQSTKSIVLCGLGDAYAALQEFETAIKNYEAAVQIARDWGYRYLEGEYLAKLAQALHDKGNRLKAIEQAEAALDVLKKLKHPEAAKNQKQLAIWRRRT